MSGWYWETTYLSISSSRAIQSNNYNYGIVRGAGAWAITYQVGAFISGSAHTALSSTISINGSRTAQVGVEAYSISIYNGAWAII